MELIDRYLQAVEFWLPKKQKFDIIAELSEDIYTQVEEQQTALGRKLNEGDVEAILKQRGSPVLVANHYLPQQHLIGPVMFPIYKFVLKIGTLCYLVPWLLVWVGLMLFDPAHRDAQLGHAVTSMLSSLWLQAFVMAGVVTLAFAVLERAQAKSQFLKYWDPRKLPPLRDPSVIKRSSAYFELVAQVAAATWWLAKMSSPITIEYRGLQIWLSPLWSYFFWGFLLLILLNAGIATANVARPYWTVRKAWLRLFVDFAGAVLFCCLLKANLVTSFVLADLSPKSAVEIANGINFWMQQIFPGAIVFVVVIAGINIYRIVRLRTPKGLPGVARLVT